MSEFNWFIDIALLYDDGLGLMRLAQFSDLDNAWLEGRESLY